jgi:hypothetical protein
MDFLTDAPLWVQIMAASIPTGGILYLTLRIIERVVPVRPSDLNGSAKGIAASLVVIAEQTRQMNEHLVEIKNTNAEGFRESRERLEKLGHNLSLAMERQITRDDLRVSQRRRKQ